MFRRLKNRPRFLPALLILGGLALTSCQTDSGDLSPLGTQPLDRRNDELPFFNPDEGYPLPEGFTIFRGRVVDLGTGKGYGPTHLNLLEADNLTVVRHTQTTEDGEFVINGVPPGRYVPVIVDNERSVFHMPQANFELKPGAPVDVEIPVAPLGVSTGDTLKGRVRDADTLEIIEGALIDLGAAPELPAFSGRTLLFSELEGFSGGLNRITGPDGRFQLFPLWYLSLPSGARTADLLVTKPGYKAYRHEGFMPRYVPRGLPVRLEKGEDTSVVTGRLVTTKGVPMPGIRVGAEWRRGGPPIDTPEPGPAGWQPADFRLEQGPDLDVIMQGITAITAQNGTFRLEGLPRGNHQIIAAYPLDDGWIGQPGVNAEAPIDGEVNVGDILLFPNLPTLHPVDGSTVRLSSRLTFAWEPVEGDVVYSLLFRHPELGEATVGSEESRWESDADLFSTPGLYKWKVEAFDRDGPVAASERFSSFIVP